MATEAEQTAKNLKKSAYKQVLKVLVPYGMLATRKWLLSKGLTAHSLDNAVKSEVLLPLANGVYSQYSRSLKWEGVVASLQRMESENKECTTRTVVGGLSAIGLAGLSQYLPLSATPSINLYSQNKLPVWVSRLSLPMRFVDYHTRRLWPESVVSTGDYSKAYQWDEYMPAVQYSCPERALFELLMDVPSTVSFEHADELMQGLVNLSPRKLDKLLQVCKNVKVKRLFFWLAKRHSHAWLTRLDAKNYDLGSGKRVIAKSGKLDKEFLVTVPSHMLANQREY